MIPGRNVPNGHTGSVSSNLLLTPFFGKMRLVCANGDSRASLLVPPERLCLPLDKETWTDLFAHVNGNHQEILENKYP